MRLFIHWKIIFLGLGLTGLLCWAYSNHFHNSFHFDDSHTIEDNPYIKDIHNIPKFFKSSETFSVLPANQAYRPLVSTSLAIDYWIASKADPKNPMNTFYFHLSTFILYIIQFILMFFIFLKIMNVSWRNDLNPYFAMFAASWYALHTAHAETVNYIISRSDMLSTLAVILSFFLYLYSGFAKRTYLYILPAAIGIFVKETAAMFPFILFAYQYIFEHPRSRKGFFTVKRFRSAFIRTLPAMVVSVCLIFFVLSKISKNWDPGDLSRYSYLITQPFVIFHYVGTWFFPFSLSADTDWRALDHIYDDRCIAGLIFISVLIYIAIKTISKKETAMIGFGIIWFFIALLPTSSLMPFAEVMNDHRIFFPNVGLVMAVVWPFVYLIYKNKKRIEKSTLLKNGIPVLACMILFMHAYGTHQRNKVWKDDETLWKDVTVKSPENGRGLMNYGLSQMKLGKYDIALDYFQRALVFNPYYSYLHVNIAIVKAVFNQDVEAEEHFKKALDYGPKYPDCYYYYANWLHNKGRVAEAKTYLQTALSLSPQHPAANALLRTIESEQPGTVKSTVDIAEVQVKTAPSADNYINLSLEYYRARRFDDCIEACKEALKIKPDYAIAYNNICSAYNEMGKYDSAIIACTKAIQLDPNFTVAKNNLAQAKQKAGK